MAFFQRMMQHLANEVLVKRLAQNRSFQRFAYKSVETVKSLKDADVTGTAKKIKTSESAGRVSGFLAQVRQEMVEDFHQLTKRGTKP